MGFVKKVQIVASGAALYMAHPYQYDHAGVNALSLKRCLFGSKKPAFGGALEEYELEPVDEKTAERLGYGEGERNGVKVPSLLVKVYEALNANDGALVAVAGVGGRVTDVVKDPKEFPMYEAKLIKTIKARKYSGFQLSRIITTNWLNKLNDEDKLLDLAYFDPKDQSSINMINLKEAMTKYDVSNKGLKLAVLRYIFMIFDMIINVQKEKLEEKERATVEGLTMMIAVNGFRAIDITGIKSKTTVSDKLYFLEDATQSATLKPSDLTDGPQEEQKKNRIYKIICDTYETIQNDLQNPMFEDKGMSRLLEKAREGDFSVVMMIIGMYLETAQKKIMMSLFLTRYPEHRKIHDEVQRRLFGMKSAANGKASVDRFQSSMLKTCVDDPFWRSAYNAFISSRSNDSGAPAEKAVFDYLVARSQDEDPSATVAQFRANVNITALLLSDEEVRLTEETIDSFDKAARHKLLDETNTYCIAEFLKSTEYTTAMEEKRSEQKATQLEAASTNVSGGSRRSSIARLLSGLSMTSLRRRSAPRNADDDISDGVPLNSPRAAGKQTGTTHTLSLSDSVASSNDSAGDERHAAVGTVPTVEGNAAPGRVIAEPQEYNDAEAQAQALALAQAAVAQALAQAPADEELPAELPLMTINTTEASEDEAAAQQALEEEAEAQAALQSAAAESAVQQAEVGKDDVTIKSSYDRTSSVMRPGGSLGLNQRQFTHAGLRSIGSGKTQS
jgi:hypothetical protein